MVPSMLTEYEVNWSLWFAVINRKFIAQCFLKVTLLCVNSLSKLFVFIISLISPVTILFWKTTGRCLIHPTFSAIQFFEETLKIEALCHFGFLPLTCGWALVTNRETAFVITAISAGFSYLYRDRNRQCPCIYLFPSQEPKVSRIFRVAWVSQSLVNSWLRKLHLMVK